MHENTIPVAIDAGTHDLAAVIAVLTAASEKYGKRSRLRIEAGANNVTVGVLPSKKQKPKPARK